MSNHIEYENILLKKKIDAIYESTTWKLYQKIARLLGNTPQSKEQFYKKLSEKIDSYSIQQNKHVLKKSTNKTHNKRNDDFPEKVFYENMLCSAKSLSIDLYDLLNHFDWFFEKSFESLDIQQKIVDYLKKHYLYIDEERYFIPIMELFYFHNISVDKVWIESFFKNKKINFENFILYIESLLLHIPDDDVLVLMNYYHIDGIVLHDESFIDKFVNKPLMFEKFIDYTIYKYMKRNISYINVMGIFYYSLFVRKYFLAEELLLFNEISKEQNKRRFLHNIRRFSRDIALLPIVGDLKKLLKNIKIDDYSGMFYSFFIDIDYSFKSEVINIFNQSQKGDNKLLGEYVSNYHSVENLELDFQQKNILHFYRHVNKINRANYALNEYTSYGTVLIIMSTYNPDLSLLKESVESILFQSYQDFILFVVDDCSNNSFEIQKLLNDTQSSKIIYHRMEENSGPYECRNYALNNSKCDFVAFQDDDDISVFNRIEYSILYLIDHEIEAVGVSNIRLNFDCRVQMDDYDNFVSQGPVTLVCRRKLFNLIGFFAKIKSRGDVEFRSRIKKIFGQKAYFQSNQVLYYSLGSTGSLSSNFEYGKDSIKLKYIRKIITHSNPKIIHEPIYASLASFPERYHKLEKLVNTILPHIDRLYVYLNNYNFIPDFLINDKIVVTLGIDSVGDLRDNGKIYNMQLMEKGYWFLIDDDIIYPDNYFEYLVRKIESYDRKAIVGIHGAIYLDKIDNYFKSRKTFHFTKELEKDIFVHHIGTGTVAFYSDLFQPKLENFIETGMCDLFFAIEAQKHQIPIVCVSRQSQWLESMVYEEDEQTLFHEFKNAHEKQTEYLIKFLPLKIFNI